jgi:hypothetical protein
MFDDDDDDDDDQSPKLEGHPLSANHDRLSIIHIHQPHQKIVGSLMR